MKFNLNELNTIVKGLNARMQDLETRAPSLRGVERLEANKEIQDIKKVVVRFKSEELG